MNISSKIAALLILALAFGLAGCPKKPERPNPNQTMMGPGGGAGLNPQMVDGDGTLFADLNSTLSGRDLNSSADRGERGILPSIYFDFDSASIRSSEQAKLQQAAQWLSANPGARLILEGHCDWRGTTEYNLGLGDRRSTRVMAFLQSIGVDSSRLETLSKGDLEANENASEAQLAEDRRVDLLVLR
jgi:peptidoglycan-associated lipoprotein